MFDVKYKLETMLTLFVFLSNVQKINISINTSIFVLVCICISFKV